MKKIAIYIRVSTARQDQEGYSIPLQKERLFAFCKAKGWVVAGLFVDPGHSGSSLERPGITALIAGIEAGKFDAVLVYKLDRLSRSQKDTLYLIEDVFMANGVDFVSMQESFDTGSIYGRAMIGVLSVFAQMERETITERTLMGRAGRAEEGLWHGGGTSPIGYDYIDGELVVNEKEAEQVRMVYDLFASGFSVTEITRRMDGYRTKHGDWSHTSTVGNVLDNPLYAGTVHFDGATGEGRHKAIVAPGVDMIVKNRRERQRRAEATGDSEFLLTGLMFCRSCGARYFPNRRPNGKVVYSCHSRAKKNKKMVKDPNCKSPHIPVEELDAMVEADVLRLAGDLSLVDELKKRATMDGSSSTESKSEEVQRLDAEIGRLMDLLQYDALVSVEEVAERIEAVHAQRVRLLPKVNEERRQYDVESAKLILRDIQFAWEGLDVRGRRGLLQQLIDRIQIDADGVRIVWAFE